MLSMTGYFEGEDGTKFYYRQRLPDGKTRAVVVGVHGYAEHGGRYDEVANLLASRGYAFYIMDNRAHGYSEGRRAHIDRYDQFVEDLRGFVSYLKPRIDGRKVFMLGHSNGSLIAIRYALRWQDELAGLVLSGAALRSAVPVPGIKLMMMPVMAKLMPTKLFNAGLDPNGLSHDKEVVQRYVDDPLVYRVISARFAFELFRAMADTLGRAAEMRAPTLMLHGEKDPACDPAAAKEFFEKMASVDKTLHVYPGMFHEVFNEIGKEKVYADMTAWVEAHT